jgi:RHS repeat-associated protein
MSGNLKDCHDYLPFGEEILAATGNRPSCYPAGTNDQIAQKFTGQERDSEAQEDFFHARYFAAPEGRFRSADSGVGQDPSDPQSLNLYSYTRNNPLAFVDPDGHSDIEATVCQGNQKCLQRLMERREETGEAMFGGAKSVLFSGPNLANTMTNTVIAPFTNYRFQTDLGGPQTPTEAKGALIADVLTLIFTAGESWLADLAPTAAISPGGSGDALAISKNYRKTFFTAHPELEGEVVVHHAVPQRTMTLYPGEVTEPMIHPIENLRGVPIESNAQLHLSEIAKEWNQFYKTHPNATLGEILQKKLEIDIKYGARFKPPR